MRFFALILAVGLGFPSAAYAAPDLPAPSPCIWATYNHFGPTPIDCSGAVGRATLVAIMDDRSVADREGVSSSHPFLAAVISTEATNGHEGAGRNVTLATYFAGSMTKPSHGQSDNGTKSLQTNGTGWGEAAEFRTKIWGRNYAGILFSDTPTSSTLWVPVLGRFTWPLRRYESDVLWTHEFPVVGRQVVPYVSAGAGAIALNGGSASGWDRQAALVGGAGGDVRLTRRIILRAGFTLDSLKASTYGDPTYHSTGTIMVEPRIGLVWGRGLPQPR